MNHLNFLSYGHYFSSLWHLIWLQKDDSCQLTLRALCRVRVSKRSVPQSWLLISLTFLLLLPIRAICAVSRGFMTMSNKLRTTVQGATIQYIFMTFSIRGTKLLQSYRTVTFSQYGSQKTRREISSSSKGYSFASNTWLSEANTLVKAPTACRIEDPQSRRLKGQLGTGDSPAFIRTKSS